MFHLLKVRHSDLVVLWCSYECVCWQKQSARKNVGRKTVQNLLTALQIWIWGVKSINTWQTPNFEQQCFKLRVAWICSPYPCVVTLITFLNCLCHAQYKCSYSWFPARVFPYASLANLHPKTSQWILGRFTFSSFHSLKLNPMVLWN